MLSRTAQYALRALAYLAAQQQDRMVRGDELSRKTSVPKNYLSKILLVLGNAGIVHAVRGSAGGYKLSTKPEKIQLIRVIELFDRSAVKETCLLGLRPVCSDKDPCTAHKAWKLAKAAYFHFLESTTLRDISFESSAHRLPRGVKTARPKQLHS